ncbi:MAG: thioredoxin [Clostridiales bacterium]|nr:thioredoxin [Clostridiales bacterium]
MSELIHFNQSTFVEAVGAGGVVVVDFWATWCGPCRMIAPAIERLADEFARKATVGKVDVDQEEELAAAYGIMSIPCVIVFKNGQEFRRLVGAQPYENFAGLVRSALE